MHIFTLSILRAVLLLSAGFTGIFMAEFYVRRRWRSVLFLVVAMAGWLGAAWAVTVV